MKKLFLLLIPLVFLISCGDDVGVSGVYPVNGTPTNPNPDISYTTPPPTGKLPFPQHNPSFTSNQYNNMMSQLWIINNFGLYQGSEQVIYDYFHDGLDIVLDNGTLIYAVEAGYVRSVINSTLVIEDKDEPASAKKSAETLLFAKFDEMHSNPAVYELLKERVLEWMEKESHFW